MKILTVENTSTDMNDIPDEIDDLRYCVIDYSDPNNVDYIFIPLVFLESYNSAVADIRIGKHRINIPMDWSIIIGDKNSGELEIIEIKKLNDRSFDAFTINPISGYMPQFLDIDIMNVFPDSKWYFPKLKFGHILAIPMENCEKPLCCFMVKETNRIPESLDITQLV